GEAMKDSKRRRSKLEYRIQQHSKGSSKGSVMRKNKADENKADAEVAEKQAGDEQLG
ncbi:hypothetical protein Tco_1339551, partial [Tanacetum coccineum]